MRCATAAGKLCKLTRLRPRAGVRPIDIMPGFQRTQRIDHTNHLDCPIPDADCTAFSLLRHDSFGYKSNRRPERQASKPTPPRSNDPAQLPQAKSISAAVMVAPLAAASIIAWT